MAMAVVLYFDLVQCSLPAIPEAPGQAHSKASQLLLYCSQTYLKCFAYFEAAVCSRISPQSELQAMLQVGRWANMWIAMACFQI